MSDKMNRQFVRFMPDFPARYAGGIPYFHIFLISFSVSIKRSMAPRFAVKAGGNRMEIEIRFLKSSDVEAVKAFIMRSDEHEMLYSMARTRQDFIENINDDLDGCGQSEYWIIAVYGGKIVGICSVGGGEALEGLVDNAAIISDLYVDPMYRRSGVGKNLVRTAEDAARKNGYTSVYADVWNRALVHVSEAYGYIYHPEGEYVTKEL